jgi:pilus assembly protein Flp/PilA
VAQPLRLLVPSAVRLPASNHTPRPVGRTLAARRARDIASQRRCLQEDEMTALVNFINSVVRKDEGQDLLEYALLVALIALVAVGAVTAAGTQVSAIFNQIAGAI